MAKKKLSRFSRIELKYLLNQEQYSALIAAVKEHMKSDEYGESVIMNIYFDTPDFKLIRASIEKPAYKEKLRLRSYGKPNDDSVVFLELKKKYKKVVYKRRENAPLCKMQNYFDTGDLPFESQIFKEIDYFFNFYKDLAPKMFISYLREAYFDKENPELRISFDTEITCRDYDLDLKLGVYGQKLLESGLHLMEIKAVGAMPLWLAHTLSENKVYKTSYSKYANAYKKLFQRGFEKCSTV